MASLSSGLKLGSGSVSSLIKSANSLETQIANYQDSLQAFEYQNSAYTDSAFSSYQNYLQGRITALNSTGTIADQQKSLTLTKTLEAAMKSNVSASIQRENIQILAGNSTKTDKYNLIVNQFQRAVDNGDMTLAQSLESQAYNLSQQIQYENQQAASAAKTLQQSGVTYEGQVADNLKKSISYFEGIAKNGSEQELNSTLKGFVQQNADTFKTLGVNIATQQPNYFDVVVGLVGAAYTHTVLKAQDEAPLDPILSHNYAIDAANLINGQTKFDTLAGSRTFSEIQSFSQDPSALAFNSSTGKYDVTTQTGYQYEQQITGYDNSGNPIMGKVLVPTYSGIVGGTNASKVFFLTPNETKVATNLGLEFTGKDVQAAVSKGQQVGVGVDVQVTQNSPQWLQKLLGKNGITKLYTDQNGDIQFQGASSTGQGSSYYTLVTDGRGLHGLFEHLPDGTSKIAGGDYGFNQGAAQLLINQAQQVQRNISLQQQMQASELKLATPPPLQQISVPQVHAPAQSISVPKVTAPTIAPPSPQIQKPTANPQQPAPVNLQSGGINLQGGGGIRLQ